MPSETINWLLDSEEPWTRFRTRLDLLDETDTAPEARRDYEQMVSHPLIQGLLDRAQTWPGPPLKRHSDASHPLYALSTLADFGIRSDPSGMQAAVDRVLAHQSPEGPFEHLGNIPRAFGGSGEDAWHWLACDAPTLLYFLLCTLGPTHPQVEPAVEHLLGVVEENGWRCIADPALGKFKGPGKRGDPCPIANVYALKALSLVPEASSSDAVQCGINMLLSHWEIQAEKKYFLFGIGTDFRKLKYPFVWYNILHVADVLSRYENARRDPHLQEMVSAILDQEQDGRYTATSMYRAWKGWSFADKKNPSPWLTFIVERISKRMGIRHPSTAA